MDWNKVKSCVAGVDSVDVMFEEDNGQLGATRLPYSGQPTAVRQPTAWGKRTYILEAMPTSIPPKPGQGPTGMVFEATKTEALNLAQSKQWPGWCFTLYHLEGGKQTNAGETPYSKVIDWTGCRRFILNETPPPPGSGVG